MQIKSIRERKRIKKANQHILKRNRMENKYLKKAHASKKQYKPF